MLPLIVLLLLSFAPRDATAQICTSSWQAITVSLSNQAIATLSNYTLSTRVPPLAGCDLTTASVISITLPEDTLADTITTGTFNGDAIAFTTKSGQAVSFAAPVAVAANATVTIVLNGVTNPTVAGPKTLTMSATPTSLGAITSTTSNVYQVLAPTATPTITQTPSVTPTTTETPTPTLTATTTDTPTPTPGPCNQNVPDNPCIPGGGSKAKDCQIEWLADPVPLLRDGQPKPDVSRGIQRNRLYCYDGDSRCDFDGQISNNSCTFRVQLCVNNTDPRLERCVPTDIDTFEVRRPRASRPRDVADVDNAATLEGIGGSAPGGFGLTVMRRKDVVEAGAPNALQDHCSSELELVVPLRQRSSGRISKGKKRFSIRTESTSGNVDTDSLSLECRPSTCGNNVVEDNHEQCDDGNRDNGDGCDQACQIEVGVPTPTPTAEGPTSTPTAAGTNTATATATATIDEPGIPFILQPGGGTTGSCRGVCSGGSNNGGSCTNNNACTGGGSCSNRTCAGGPLAGTSCSNANQCNGCALSPPQGSCAIVQSNLLAIRVPLNGVCVPRDDPNNDVSCSAQVECPSGKTCRLPKFNLVVGDPDPVTGEAEVVAPASTAFFAPTLVTGIGTVCVAFATDGMGTVDCDGGRPDLDWVFELDHNTTPGNGNNSGPANGLPDDPECDNTLPQPDGTTSYACRESTSQCSAGANEGMVCTNDVECPGGVCEPCLVTWQHQNICNSPRRVTASATLGTGDLVMPVSLSIQILDGASQFGPDFLACTADDTGDPPAAVGIVLTTGMTTIRIHDQSNTNGSRISPANQCPPPVGPQCIAEIIGAPFNCPNLIGGITSGAKLGGGFPALEQAIGDIATTFQFTGN